MDQLKSVLIDGWGIHTFTPSGLVAFVEMQMQLDVRHVLPVIQVPTLVLERQGDTYRDPRHGQYLAEHIPGAKYVQLDGTDHFWPVGDAGSVIDEIHQFVTGVRPAPETDRVLATDVVAGSGIEFDDRGMHELKGIPDAWRLFAVNN